MPNLGVFVVQEWAVVSKGLNYVRNYSDLFLLLWQLKPHFPQIYKKPLIRQKIISYERVLQLFPNLEELILIHGEQMLCIAVECCVVRVKGALRARGSRNVQLKDVCVRIIISEDPKSELYNQLAPNVEVFGGVVHQLNIGHENTITLSVYECAIAIQC